MDPTKRPGLLGGDNLEKFKGAFIDGDVFADHASDVEIFENKCNLPIGISIDLVDMARELIADELTIYQNGALPNIAELANAIYAKMKDRYSEALFMLKDSTLPIAQCILSRRLIHLRDNIPGSDLKWENVVSSGLIWFERADIDSVCGPQGCLVAPYIWLWMLARLPPENNTESLCQFLSTWKFNDYEQLLSLEADQGFPGDTTWQTLRYSVATFAFCGLWGLKMGRRCG